MLLHDTWPTITNNAHVYPDRIYELVVRQEPKQARMCGVGGKGMIKNMFFIFVYEKLRGLLQLTVALLTLLRLCNCESSILLFNQGIPLQGLQRREEIASQIPLPPVLQGQDLTQTMRPIHQIMHSRFFKIHIISCSQVLLDLMMKQNCIG